jgi:hypothetical protein
MAPATYAPGAQLAVIKGDPTKEVYGEFLINAQGEDVVVTLPSVA